MTVSCIYLQYRSVNTSSWSGTGWFINKYGYLVTADHVVAGARSLDVIYKGRDYKASVVARDHTHDVAILKIGISDPNIISITIRSNSNSRVVILGYPIPDYYKYEEKMFYNTVTFGGFMTSMVYLHGNICPGNSGGPIVDSYGNSLGVVTVGYTQYQDENTRCCTEGGGASSKYVIDLARKYNISIVLDNFRVYHTFKYWFSHYKDSVVIIYGER